MTDRIKGFTVTLSDDIRIDDIEKVVDAIKMIKGVSNVDLNVLDSTDLINRNRISNEYRKKLYNFIKNELD